MIYYGILPIITILIRAFLNGRVGYDIGAAGLHGFFNPLMDIPLYLLIENFNNYPGFIYFIQGLWFGGLLFVSFKIFRFFFNGNTWKEKISVALCLLIGSTGFSVFMQIGTSSNEIQIAFFILVSVYLLIREIFEIKSGRWKIFLLSGFLLGSAMGLKLTAVTYCLAGGITLLCFWRSLQKPLHSLIWFGIGGLAGFLVFNGFWMWKMWEMFQNPFFPFLNNIFKSPYLPYAGFRDANYLPQNITEFLFQPIIRAANIYQKDGQHIVVEYRYALVYIIFLVSLLLSFKKKFISELSPRLKFLSLFVLIGYTVCMLLFNIFRYLVPLEVLLPVFIIKAFWYCFPKGDIKRIIYISVANVLLFQLLSTPYFSDAWGMRKDFKSPFINKQMIQNGRRYMIGYDKFVNMEKLNLPDNTLVLMYNLQSAFALPVLSENTKNIRGLMMRQASYIWTYMGQRFDLYHIGRWGKIRQQILKQHKGPKIAFIVQEPDAGLIIKPWQEKELRDMKCEYVYNNVMPEWILCVPPELKESIFADRKGKSNVQ